jgi:ATP-dependent DNA helicase RecG
MGTGHVIGIGAMPAPAVAAFVSGDPLAGDFEVTTQNFEQLANISRMSVTDLLLALPELRIGLIHGRMKPKEKVEIMAAFKAGQLHLLVATTVIEVGVDVPNASLMIIENAERLGLAQLHQLRGRVGRGTAESHCLLL